MPLSESFPPELVAQLKASREEIYRSKIIPGAVIRLTSTHTTKTKTKRFLVVNADPLKLFIINTEIFARHLNSQTWAIPHQVKVEADGSCFDSECHIDCSNFWDEFEFEDIVQQCVANTCEVLGNISSIVAAEVFDRVSGCRTFSTAEQSLIAANLSS